MKKKLFILFLTNIYLTQAQTTPAAQIDSTFVIGNGFNSNPNVRLLENLPNNRILVTRSGTQFNNSNISSSFIVLNNNGSIHQQFNFNGSPYCVFIENDGSFLVGGDGSSLVKYNSNYTINTSFSYTTQNNPVHFIDRTLNGKYLLLRRNPNNYNQNQIIRINSNGSQDSSFGSLGHPNYSSIPDVKCFKSLEDGSFLVFKEYPSGGNRINRYNYNGTIDNSFTPILFSFAKVEKIKIHNEQLYLIVLNGGNRTLKRYNMDGTIDNTFSSPENLTSINDFDFFSNNKIVVCNYATGSNSLKILNIDGTIDDIFNIGGVGFQNPSSSGANDDLAQIVRVQNNKILVGGRFGSYLYYTKRGILRLNGLYQTLSVANYEISNTLKLYPNPAKEILYFSNSENNIKEYEIYDLLGKKVLSGEVFDNSVNVSSLSKGVYIIGLKDENNMIVKQKFIKE